MSLGLVFASCSLLNELRTIQKTGKKIDQADDPGHDAEGAVDPSALADDDRSRGGAHAISSPFRRPDRTRSAIVAMTIEAMTTTMLYDDAWPNSQPPPIDRWKTK